MQVAAKARIRFDGPRVKKRIETGTIESLFKAAGYIRTTASRSIKQTKASPSVIRPDGTYEPNKSASRPGTPPHTQTRQLRKSIAFAVNRQTSTFVVGPKRSGIAEIGAVHEHGRVFHGRKYPKRPFMRPAYAVAKPRLSGFWAGAVHN